MASKQESESSVPSIADVRTKGQVWTPRWVADIMASTFTGRSIRHLLDPAIGPGVLVAATKDAVRSMKSVTGFEIDPNVVLCEDSSSSTSPKSYQLRLESFIHAKVDAVFDAVIANPPYLRHHRIDAETKSKCREICQEVLGIQIDARAGIHIYFLVKSLGSLVEGGRLCFILPADAFEGVFASKLWRAISSRYSIDGFLKFQNENPAFPSVDTNAVIVFISKNEPRAELTWVEVQKKPTAKQLDSLARLLNNEIGLEGVVAFAEAMKIPMGQAVDIGFTRKQDEAPFDSVPFSAVARVIRGIATGANEVFLMNSDQVAASGIPKSSFVRTISRVRDAIDEPITDLTLEKLDRIGRPTYLLSLDGEQEVSEQARKYFESFEDSGISSRPLVKSRKHWYVMERRVPPPLLFAYLGRRNVRFLRCDVTLQPLTGFLCVYPHPGFSEDALFKVLNHPLTIAQLARVGKSYGNGALKVEPGGLRQLRIPREAFEASGIPFPTSHD